MNIGEIQIAMKNFIAKHSMEFQDLAVRESALLELGALTMASEHYRLAGYTVQVENPKEGLFAAKLTSRGHPYNFSWFRCERDGTVLEIHSNLAVAGAHKDDARYVVDVAVVDGDDAVPKSKPKKPWDRLENSRLSTFVEVKKLVVYPMLLAQFVGIVHEISPNSLKAKKWTASAKDHFAPSLISLGYLQGTSASILAGFVKRKYNICVIHNFDVHLSSMKNGVCAESPFVAIKKLV